MVKPGTSKLGVGVIEIHEDDWRQIEWLPASASGIIESELGQINGVLENNRKGVGFAKCHLRENIPTLSNGRVILLNELRTLIQENATWLSGFGFRGLLDL